MIKAIVLLFFLLHASMAVAELHCLDVQKTPKLRTLSYGAHLLTGRLGGVPMPFPENDCLSGLPDLGPTCEYPRNSNINNLSTILWVGGIVNSDTIVTAGVRTLYKNKLSKYRSDLVSRDSYSDVAYSENDVVSFSSDTFYVIPNTNGLRVPLSEPRLHIEIQTRSMSWSFEYAEDMVLFEIKVKNIGTEYIREGFLGLRGYANFEYFIPGYPSRAGWTISGFKDRYEHTELGGLSLPYDMVWYANATGIPNNGEYTDQLFEAYGLPTRSATHASGYFFLNERRPDEYISFNWWDVTDDYGPFRKDTYRRFANGNYVYPDNSEDMYFYLSNGDIDFDQIYTPQISQADSVWVYPDQEAAPYYALGYPVHTLYSIGPFDIGPNEEVTYAVALVFGDNFHADPTNGEQNLPNNPDQYMQNINFTDLAKNSLWARWIYDNPGVDTDGDGFAGDSIIVDGVVKFISGDGVPDWKATGPPPAPAVWVTPVENGVKVRFNGSFSETTPDVFTQTVDFEGYNVYIGRDDRESSYSLVASYDRENYDILVWNNLTASFKQIERPYTIEELRCRFGGSSEPCNDTLFHPLLFDRKSRPLKIGDSIYIFQPHGFNVNALTSVNSINKVYPYAIDPRLVLEEEIDSTFYTEEGFYKFFEYEFTIDNLLPTIPYWVAVSSFDFGSPLTDFRPLESAKEENAQAVIPLSIEEAKVSDKRVYVYPNPYRIDGKYRIDGFEGRTNEYTIDDRVRDLWFANLPYKCVISIYTIDGDLVRRLHHDKTPSDPQRHRHSWDMITRNAERVVSGLYYWTVETVDGTTQIGKFAVIK